MDELVIKLLSSRGLRIHEALGITKKQVENTDDKGNELIGVISKNMKIEIVVIPTKLVKELQKYKLSIIMLR